MGLRYQTNNWLQTAAIFTQKAGWETQLKSWCIWFSTKDILFWKAGNLEANFRSLVFVLDLSVIVHNKAAVAAVSVIFSDSFDSHCK